MMHYVTRATYLENYRIRLRFEDGAEKDVDLSAHISGHIFQPLRDISYFRSFEMNQDIDTICWANGADFSPDFLYEIGVPVKDCSDQKSTRQSEVA